MKSFQEKIWSNNFGKEYTRRNTLDIIDLNKLYKNSYGISREEINQEFLKDLDREIRILEVGANTGNQLLLLQEMGFLNLYGIELQDYAVETAKSRSIKINIIQGSACDIPFKDNYFDLVFTSGLLIHISPENLSQAMSEIYRCSRNLIWGFEYFTEEIKEINYRGNMNLLWKANYSKIYLDSFPKLKLVKERFYPYLNSENVDVMFLLRKES